MTDKTVAIATLGCKVNQYESEAIAEVLAARGWEIRDADEVCTAYIINTCTVTSESDRKARQTIRRALTKNPSALVLVTGCYSQVSPDDVAAISGVDYVCGSSNKLSVADALDRLYALGRKNTATELVIPSLDGSAFESMTITRFDRTRAYVKIEDGCESKCTYCTIPAARGAVRSKPADEVIAEIERLTKNGCREVVLTGIETGSYGVDIFGKPSLGKLLQRIDKIDGIGRVRLGSLDPSIIKPEFVETIAPLSSLAPHFHLSMQSGSDRILALMKRKYNSSQAMRAVELLRDAFPSLQLTTDMIVGFPSEGEQDFEASRSLIQNVQFLMTHVFPYSRRKGTPAAEMPSQIPEQIKHSRVSMLSSCAADMRKIRLDAVMESSRDVLFESYSNGYAYGHTPEFIEVRVKSDRNMHAEIHKVTLTSNDGNVCDGMLV